MPDKFEKLAELRSQGAVFAAGEGVHLVVRHTEAAEVLRDYRSFSSDVAAVPAADPPPQELDPPAHTRIRGLLLATGIAREAAESVRPQVEELWSRLAADVAMRSRVELVDEFSRPGVRASFGEVLGIPAADRERVYRWVGEMRDAITYSPPKAFDAGAEGAAASFAAYILGEAQKRRVEEPRGKDLFTRLLFAVDADGGTATEHEIVMLMRVLCQGGIGSTSRAIGNLLFELIRAPSWYRRIRDDRTLIGPAVEESLRHDTPGTTMQRVCTNETTLDGVTINPGDVVVVNLQSANRDETVYATPDCFNPDRSRLPEHLAFGRGRHRCIGMRLARLFMATAVNAFLDHIPEPPLRAAGFAYEPETFGAWGPRNLEVEMRAKPAAGD